MVGDGDTKPSWCCALMEFVIQQKGQRAMTKVQDDMHVQMEIEGTGT